MVRNWTEMYTYLFLFTLFDWYMYHGHSATGINENKYIRQSDKRSSVSDRIFPSLSAIQCCAACRAQESCTIASYNEQEHQCELTDALPGGATVTMVTENGWNIYYRAASCETGWHTYGTSCYLFQVTTSHMWAQAKVACESIGGHLVYIQTGEEMTYLIQTLTDHYPGDLRLWIGARDNGEGGGSRVFSWSDGTPLSDTYTNWDTSQPDTASENCVEIKTAAGHRWNDKECNAELSYICERDIG